MFTINVKSDPSIVPDNRYITFNRTLLYKDFSSRAIFKYYSGGNCMIQNTTISMSGFNPNFNLTYESGT